jgi:rifampicin phosphotransferase
MTDQTQTSRREVDDDMLPPSHHARRGRPPGPGDAGTARNQGGQPGAPDWRRLPGAGRGGGDRRRRGRLDQAGARLRTAAAELGGGPGRRFAVRSSASAEDLAGASFAGQYETVLDVRLEELPEAVRHVVDSATAARVAAYSEARTEADATAAGPRDPCGPGAGMAVLVQVMVAADAAGVAFTANPLTGDRDEVVITAVRGLGERLVAGQATGDQWVVRDGQASCTRATEQAITADQARQIAALARHVHAYLARPQDVEWAITTDPTGSAGTDGGEGGLWLLQARPMTALPDPVTWTPPAAGYWMRNFRLGEWLPEPMTPLFADWLLDRIDHGERQATRDDVGTTLPFPHAAINGWYYLATPPLSPRTILTALLQGRGRLLRFMRHAVLGPGRDPVAADRQLLAGLAEQWRTELLPRYQRLVHEGEQQLPTASREQLVGIVDRVGSAAGEQLWSLAVVGGSAWKMEGALARFYRQHLAATLAANVQELLAGLPGSEPDLPAHAVQSLDWVHATAGELGWQPPRPSDRHRELAARRDALTAQCVALLGDRPQLQARFRALLEVAQRYAVLREQQARQLTLGWPLLRRCTLRLGRTLHAHGVIDEPEDVFYLTRAELDTSAPLQELVSRRQAAWERQRRLLAPLTIGRPPRLLAKELLAAVDAVRTTSPAPQGAIVGQPASPGRVSGPVHIVHEPGDFNRFQSGEVLVTRATAPAWTPLFARAVAVVTDGGTLAAHASLVAREYGIPAVVATGDATARLRDGQLVTVDGGAGTVHAAQSSNAPQGGPIRLS